MDKRSVFIINLVLVMILMIPAIYVLIFTFPGFILFMIYVGLFNVSGFILLPLFAYLFWRLRTRKHPVMALWFFFFVAYIIPSLFLSVWVWLWVWPNDDIGFMSLLIFITLPIFVISVIGAIVLFLKSENLKK